ncbi:MAG: hypothetical protein ACXADW_21490 [Candidatus Hodarchaeales archaeon]
MCIIGSVLLIFSQYLPWGYINGYDLLSREFHAEVPVFPNYSNSGFYLFTPDHFNFNIILFSAIIGLINLPYLIYMIRLQHHMSSLILSIFYGALLIFDFYLILFHIRIPDDYSCCLLLNSGYHIGFFVGVVGILLLISDFAIINVELFRKRIKRNRIESIQTE